MPRPSCRAAAVEPDAQLTDQCVGHTGPGLGADRGVDRVLAVELGPVAAIDRDLVWRAGRVDRAVGCREVLIEDDRLRRRAACG